MLKFSFYASFEDLRAINPDRCKNEVEFKDYCNQIDNQIDALRKQGNLVEKVIVKASEFQQWLKQASIEIQNKPAQEQVAIYVGSK